MYMRSAKLYAGAIGLNHQQRVKICGELEVRAVMHVHGKKAKGRKIFSSLAEIAQGFLTEALPLADPSKVGSVPVPWKVDAAASSSASSVASGASVSHQPMRQFDGTSMGVQDIEKLGYKVGATVEAPMSRDPDASNSAVHQYIIVAIGMNVQLKAAGDDNLIITVSPARLVDEFKVVQTTTSFEVAMPGLLDPVHNPEFVLERIKAIVKVAVAVAWEQHHAETLVKMVQTGKSRTVFVEGDYQKGDLVLVPLSTSVQAAENTPPVGIECNLLVPDPTSVKRSLRIFISPKCELLDESVAEDVRSRKSFAVPCFCVKSSPDTAAVNMTMGTVEVNIQVALGNQSHITVVKIPVMTNTKNLQAGAELFAKAGPKAVPKGKPVIVAHAQATSKQHKLPAASQGGKAKRSKI